MLGCGRRSVRCSLILDCYNRCGGAGAGAGELGGDVVRRVFRRAMGARVKRDRFVTSLKLSQPSDHCCASS